MISSNTKIVSQGSYSISFQQSFKKMTKTAVKSAEYKAVNRNNLKSFVRMLEIIKIIFVKQYKLAFPLVIGSSNLKISSKAKD